MSVKKRAKEQIRQMSVKKRTKEQISQMSVETRAKEQIKEADMSAKDLKKSRRNYWFTTAIIAFALFCVGAALLYSQKLLTKDLSKPKTPVASYTTRYSGGSISKVQFLKRDMLLDKDETSNNWLKSIRAAQRKKNIKHLYDEYKNVGIFQVTEDVKYNSLFATYKLKLLKNIKSTHSLQVGNTINAYTFGSPCLDTTSVSAVYKSSDIMPLLRKNECYLLVYGDPAESSTLNTLRSHGAKNGTYYCLDYGSLFDTGLRLSKEKNLTTIKPKKVYDTKELQSFDLFCGSKTILKEWYRTKDAVLTYYVGKNYDKQF